MIICAGIILTLLISEILLRALNFNMQVRFENAPKNFPYEKFIRWAYIDICYPFFKKENDVFYIQREDIWIDNKKNSKFTIKKNKDTTRIFIVGESTAAFYDSSILNEKLSKYISVEIINCGMGAYDSYRIEKITREIKYFEPDWVIFLIGNNDGIDDRFANRIKPIDINSIPYRYALFNKVKTLGLISRILHKEICLNENNVEKNFQKNILRMVKNLKNSKIIFCDLPNNEEYKLQFDDNTNKTLLWKNYDGYKSLLKRMQYFREISEKNNNVFVTNLTQKLREYTNNNLGYNIFTDDCHFTRATYTLLSDLITQTIIMTDYNKQIGFCIERKTFLKLLEEDNVNLIAQTIRTNLNKRIASGIEKKT